MKKAFIQLHAAIFLAGFTGILGRLITLNEGLLVWYRMMIASLSLWILLYFQKKLEKVSLKDAGKIVGIGALVALHWVTFYGSIKYSNVSVALVCFSSIGFFTAILEPLITKKRFEFRELLLGLVAIAGIYLIFHFDPKFKTGIIVGIISALLGSLFPILNRGLLLKFKPNTVTLYELAGGFLFLSILLPFYLGVFPPDHFFPTLPDLGWLLILAWVCTVLAFSLLMNSLEKISAFTVNLSYNLEPVYGIALAFMVYGENRELTAIFYVGLSLILLSVAIQSWNIYRFHSRRNLEM